MSFKAPTFSAETLALAAGSALLGAAVGYAVHAASTAEKKRASANIGYGKGGACDDFVIGGPMLKRDEMSTEGLAFLGLSLTRNHSDQGIGHSRTVTRQVQFDFNRIQDREYKYFQSTNDDGWLLGGGEDSKAWKLENLDSAHCELVRLGTFEEHNGGLSAELLSQAIRSKKILIPEFHVMPTAVFRNGDRPPEVEVRFDVERMGDPNKPDKWPNWQLQFVMNQVYEMFEFPARFTPGAFHMTFVRKAKWRSEEKMQEYFKMCDEVIKEWRKRGPVKLDGNQDSSKKKPGGVYLFKDRNTIVDYFPPNFFPPYNTPEKRELIKKVLSKTWDEPARSWKQS